MRKVVNKNNIYLSMYDQIQKSKKEEFKRTLYISVLCALVGLICGFGTAAFNYLINFFYNLLFFGRISFYGSNATDFISRWGKLVVFVPAVAIMISNFISHKSAPEARGHGVPEVMVAISEDGGKIRPIVGFIKMVVSAVTIGGGGSVGREGPIVQIGASFGSTIAQIFHLSQRETIILTAAGTAGGLGAVFNAPIGGVMFAIELIIPEISIMTVMPLVVSSVGSIFVIRVLFGPDPQFVIPVYTMVSNYELLIHILLGVLCGLLSVGFIKTNIEINRYINSVKIPYIFKSLIGGTLVGCAGYLSLKEYGRYYLLGTGADFMEFVLSNGASSIIMLLIIIGLKFLTTSITLGSGGSGGIFTPAIYLGCALGGVVGIIANFLFPGEVGHVAAYAIVGMCGMLSGVTGAVFTSIILLFEMTRNYEVMLPLMLSAVISNFVSRLIYSETIFTYGLVENGYHIVFNKRISSFTSISVKEAMKTNFVFVNPSDTIEKVLVIMRENNLSVLPVIEKDNIVIGTVSYRELYKAKDSKDSSEIKNLVKCQTITIPSTADLSEALEVMHMADSDCLVVKENGKNIGVLTPNRIIRKGLEKRGSL